MNGWDANSGELDALRASMQQERVFEKDLEEKFIRSPGRGGQNVNKLATCVFLRHRPTAVTVKCHRHRTQGRNRYLARVLLVRRIAERRQAAAARERARREKLRRQKRRRSRKAKEAMLEGKRRRSERKQSRRRVEVRGGWGEA